MTVRERRGKPLPEGHPFKGTLIFFGQRRPAATSGEQDSPPTPERAGSEAQHEVVGGERLGGTEPAGDQEKKVDR